LIEIRRARAEDSSALGLLLESFMKEDEPWIREVAVQLGKEREWIKNFIENDRDHLSGGGKLLFFAFDSDRLVGHVNGMSWAHAPKDFFDRMIKEYGLDGERPGHVGIAVHKDYRRKGIGTQLMLKALNELREMRCTVIIADVNVDNKPSLLFLSRMGFVEHRRVGNQVLLKKEIRDPLTMKNLHSNR
jgi:ribosomal protein S18 acetylase RimI-like enzyme